MSSALAKNRFLSRYLQESPGGASQVLLTCNASELSGFIRNYSPESIGPALNFLPSSMLADAFELVENEILLPFFSVFSVNALASVLRHWQIRGGSAQAKSIEIQEQLDAKLAKSLKTLLAFSVGTLGSLMNPIPISIPSNISIFETLELLQMKKDRYSRYIYVVNDQSQLEGVLPFKDAFYADGTAAVSQVMTSNVFSFRPDLGAREAFESTSWRKWDSIPVTNNKKQLLGVIRYDVLEEVVQGHKITNAIDDHILIAGAAVGEVFQIGISATIAALGLDMRKK